MDKTVCILQGGWEGHEPEASVNRFRPFLEANEYTMTIVDDLAALDTLDLPAFDLVLPCWTMGNLSESQEEKLCQAIQKGTGLAGWHGGMGDAFRNNTQYQWMVGGQFVAHPGNCMDYTVQITRPDDPVMTGLSDFPVHSEQYYMHVDPSNEVLATTTFEGTHAQWTKGCVMPTVWKRYFGTGKVFYSAFGHVASEFDHPTVRTIMERGILWATR